METSDEIIKDVGDGLTKPVCCVVCQETGAIHLHHVIPRAYGGLNGPTVPLCNDHHEAIHHCADLEMSPADYDQLSSRRATFGKGRKQAAKLVAAIIRARDLVEADGDRRIGITFMLPQKQHAAVKRLARKNNTSMTRLVSRIVQDYLRENAS